MKSIITTLDLEEDVIAAFLDQGIFVWHDEDRKVLDMTEKGEAIFLEYIMKDIDNDS